MAAGGLVALVGGAVLLGRVLSAGKIKPGQTPGLRFTWRNEGTNEFRPQLRFDIREEAPLAGWKDGGYITAPALLPEETSEELIIKGQSIPSDWTKGTTIEAKLVARIDGKDAIVWQRAKAFTVAEL